MAAVVGGFAALSGCGPEPLTGPGAGTPGATPLGTGAVGPGADFSLLGEGRPLVRAPVGGVVDRSAAGFGGGLRDGGTGAAVGRFQAQALGPGGMELLQLELAEGALYAAGPSGGSRHERSYAVLGGTGKLAGVRGTLTTRETGDGGTLEFSGTLS
jgi:hypothetical protein